MNKKILIIGDANSFLLIELLKNIKKNRPNIDFYILQTNPILDVIDQSVFENVFLPTDFYASIIKLVGRFSHNVSFNLMRVFFTRFFNTNTQQFDITHIHFFNSNFLSMNVNKFTRNTSKLIISIWGSDFYKRSDKQLGKMLPFLEKAQAITFANSSTRDSFVSKFPLLENKVIISKFGLSIFENIDIDRNQSKETLLRRLGIFDQDYLEKIIITIGYSSSVDHRHLEIMKRIKDSIHEDVFAKLLFLFPLTYDDANYRKEVIVKLNQLAKSTVFFTSTLSNENVSALRCATDIFIHLRKTDQFSGSFQEHLYAGSVVITGSWLPYNSLLKDGAFFNVLKDMDELPDVLKMCLENMQEEKNRAKSNRKILHDISAWPKVINSHLSLYD
ncbi:MAG: hypothetical protein JXR53_12110 [Bacteroidales bacterium]|nr:hypothetical protein [Bacteroidales bacterium]